MFKPKDAFYIITIFVLLMIIMVLDTTYTAKLDKAYEQIDYYEDYVNYVANLPIMQPDDYRPNREKY